MGRRIDDWAGKLDVFKYDPKDIERNTRAKNKLTLARLSRMIKIEGLPESMPQRPIILSYLTAGHIDIIKHEEKLYGLVGELGGEPDPYYLPTICTIANPALNLSKMYKIHEDCVVIPCTSTYTGILPIITKYNYLMTINEMTMYMSDILARAALVFKAEDERQIKSAEAFIKDLEAGKLGVIANDTIMGENGVEVQIGAQTASGSLTNLIEYQVFLKGSMWNELGLNANWNAKREALGANESALNTDTLITLTEDILKNLNEGFEEVEKLFGVKLTASLDSAWEDNKEELETEQELLEAEVEATEEQPAEETEEERPEEEQQEEEKKEDEENE